jgi:hypothetical protein
MADTEKLINDARLQTLSLVTNAGNAAGEAGFIATRYKAAMDGVTINNGSVPLTTNAFNEYDAYTVPNITLPVTRPLYQNSTNISGDIEQAFKDAFTDMHDDMEAGIAEYVATWFPSVLCTRVENWIGDVILNGGRGIPANIEAMIWAKAVDREIGETRKMEFEALNGLASRGFSIPTGALAHRLMMVQQEAADKARSLSRDIAIKVFDAYREDVKFAVEQGTKVRQSAITALGDFVRTWMAPQGVSAQVAQAKADAESKMVNTAADYYRAIVSEAELSLKAHQIMAGSHDHYITTRANQDYQSEKLGVDGNIAKAQVYGQMASSAASAFVSMVGAETQLIGAAL